MYDFIAMTEATTQVHQQFRHTPDQERSEAASTAPITVRARLRLQVSAALHALANAIEPTPVCVHDHAR